MKVSTITWCTLFVPGFDHREAVMTGIEMEEERLERPQRVVAQPEAEQIPIERQHVVDPLDVHHDVAHAERTGAEAGDGAAGPERIRGDLRAVERFEHVADRIVEARGSP